MSSDGGQSEIFAPGLLAGRVALVTGGGTGLGKSTAFELARCGATVTIAGRRAEVLEEAVGEARDAGLEGLDWVAGGVREPAEAGRLIETLLARHGRLGALVSHAGGPALPAAELI